MTRGGLPRFVAYKVLSMGRLVAVLFALIAAAAGYVRPALVRPVARPAVAARPATPLKPALRMMAEEAAAAEITPAEANEVCIEDEAIEECVLAEWPAGQLKVRPPRGVLHRAFSPARVRFPSATAKSRAH